MNMGAFPSGQWGQTVNLLLNASVVRIHQLPPKSRGKYIAAAFSLFQHCKMQPRQLHFTVLPRRGFIPLRTCNLRCKRV